MLARAARPGYPHNVVSRIEVEDWVREARSLGICTIICLMSDSELGMYAAALGVVGGLLGFYRSRGFAVKHVPVEPTHDPAVSDEQLEQVLDTFKSSDKPVLVHASGDLQRTNAAVSELEHFLGGS